MSSPLISEAGLSPFLPIIQPSGRAPRPPNEPGQTKGILSCTKTEFKILQYADDTNNKDSIDGVLIQISKYSQDSGAKINKSESKYFGKVMQVEH